jgi:hypothetical protein
MLELYTLRPPWANPTESLDDRHLFKLAIPTALKYYF